MLKIAVQPAISRLNQPDRNIFGWIADELIIGNVHIDDPPGLTMGLEDEARILDVYRRVRDEIELFVQQL